MTMLQIGFASREITPSRPAMIQGQKHRRIGHEALDPIAVTAWAIVNDDATQATVLVACDLVAPSDGLYAAVRAQLAAMAFPVPGDAIILAATHTHTSLVLEDGFYEDPGDDVMTPAECEAWVATRIVDSIREAWEQRQPRRIAHAFEHAVVGHNRYAVYADGAGQMYGKTRHDDFDHIGGYEDHSLDLLFAWDTDGTLAGAIIVIPCPSQVTEGLDTFSADYWHEVRCQLQARFGEDFSILGLCGAAGDQSPHFLLYAEQEAQMRQRRGVSERDEIGRRVTDAVERALACTPPPSESEAPCLAHDVQRLELTPRQITRVERDWAESAYAESVAKGDTRTWWPKRLQAVVDTYDGKKSADRVPADIHILRLGDLAIATNPFELFLDYGLRIKARSEAARTFVVQLAGRGFYLPTARGVAIGGYGAMPAVSVAGPDAGAELVEATLTTIGKMFTDPSKETSA